MRFIRPCEVLRMSGVSRTTRWRMGRDGLFPAPVRITKRNTGYVLDDVEGWMRERARVPSTAAMPPVPVAGAARHSLLRAPSRAQG